MVGIDLRGRLLRRALFVLELPQLLAAMLELGLALGHIGRLVFLGQAFDRGTRIGAIDVGARHLGVVIALHQQSVEDHAIFHQIIDRYRGDTTRAAGSRRHQGEAKHGDSNDVAV